MSLWIIPLLCRRFTYTGNLFSVGLAWIIDFGLRQTCFERKLIAREPYNTDIGTMESVYGVEKYTGCIWQPSANWWGAFSSLFGIIFHWTFSQEIFYRFQHFAANVWNDANIGSDLGVKGNIWFSFLLFLFFKLPYTRNYSCVVGAFTNI